MISKLDTFFFADDATGLWKIMRELWDSRSYRAIVENMGSSSADGFAQLLSVDLTRRGEYCLLENKCVRFFCEIINANLELNEIIFEILNKIKFEGRHFPLKLPKLCKQHSVISQMLSNSRRISCNNHKLKTNKLTHRAEEWSKWCSSIIIYLFRNIFPSPISDSFR